MCRELVGGGASGNRAHDAMLRSPRSSDGAMMKPGSAYIMQDCIPRSPISKRSFIPWALL